MLSWFYRKEEGFIGGMRMRRWGLRMIKISGKRKPYLLLCGILVLMGILNALAWKSKAFCDFYVVHIYPLWVNTYGRLMGIFPFSVGEIMIAAGAFLTAIALLLAMAFVAIFLFKNIFLFFINKISITKPV